MPPKYEQPSDFPPKWLPPVGISFDSKLPADVEALNCSPSIVQVTDEIGPYSYDFVDPATQEPPAALDAVYEAMGGLHPTQQEAISLFFGLDTGDPLTYAGLATALGVTKFKARRRLNSGLQQLQLRLRGESLLGVVAGDGAKEAEAPVAETAEAPDEPVVLPVAGGESKELEIPVAEPAPAAAAEPPASVPTVTAAPPDHAPEVASAPAPAPDAAANAVLPDPAPVRALGEPERPAGPTVLPGVHTYRRRHIPPPAPLGGPTVLFAGDVGEQHQKWEIDFDTDRYREALRKTGFLDTQIDDHVVLMFASRTVANWLLAPSGTVGRLASRRASDPLELLPAGERATNWPKARVIAIQAGWDANAQLAYHTLAMSGNLPAKEEYELTARGLTKVLSATAGATCLSIAGVMEYLLDAPEIAGPAGAAAVAGFIAYAAAAALWPTKRARAVQEWQDKFGPIITRAPRRPQP